MLASLTTNRKFTSIRFVGPSVWVEGAVWRASASGHSKRWELKRRGTIGFILTTPLVGLSFGVWRDR